MLAPAKVAAHTAVLSAAPRSVGWVVFECTLNSGSLAALETVFGLSSQTAVKAGLTMAAANRPTIGRNCGGRGEPDRANTSASAAGEPPVNLQLRLDCYFFALRFAEVCFVFFFFADVLLVVMFFVFGTLAPVLRASDNPMAMACLRLVTVLPERPLFSVPPWRFFIARPTFLAAVVESFLVFAFFAMCRFLMGVWMAADQAAYTLGTRDTVKWLRRR